MIKFTTRSSSSFTSILALVVVLHIAAGCGTRSEQLASPSSSASPRFYDGFGNYHRRARTNSAVAQQWFDQGMQLLYGFNHDEAIRSFEQAAAVDPNCAIAWWGVAYANGLHINNPEMTEEQSRQAYDAAQQAVAMMDYASPVERSLIRAVAARYEWPMPEDRAHLDQAYAAAMEEAWKRHPSDPDVGALYAESLMNLQPWDMWTHEGEPKGRTLEIVEVLERVMEIDPRHPGANHFYIHAAEASLTPERALPAADRLGSLVPGSGHLVHMPSHIYIRTGQYAKAADANERAIAADEAYFAVAPEPRFYALYFLHNVHFLAYAAMMEGRHETAMNAARKIEEQVPEAFLRDYVKIGDGLMPTALHVMIRFGKWNDILREPEPPAFRLVSRAERHFARSVALSALGRTDEARQELALLDALAEQIDDTWFVGNNDAPTVLAIASTMARGELAYAERDIEEAFALLREAVVMEEGLAYDEPPGWMQPVRHALGALLLAEGRAAEAERVYREDLKRHPNNCWSLLGLEQSLAKLGRADEAAALRPQVAAAWVRADVKPVASCYCHPDAARVEVTR